MLAAPEQPILEYRRDRLLSCGFPFDWAHALALDRSVDIHDARELASRCGHELAWRILMPLDHHETSLDMVAIDEPTGHRSYLDRLRRYV